MIKKNTMDAPVDNTVQVEETAQVDTTVTNENVKVDQVDNTGQVDTSEQLEVIVEKAEEEPYGKYTALVKWFSDKLGYGFVTIHDGDEKGKDIFVHHSGIKPLNSNYKTLRKGEYIQFNIVNGLNGLQAVDVTGIKGGPLMCDYVTSKRVVTPVTQNGGNDGWQTVRHYPHPPPPRYPAASHNNYAGPIPPPPPQQKLGKPSTRQFKNVAKYNKATRPK